MLCGARGPVKQGLQIAFEGSDRLRKLEVLFHPTAGRLPQRLMALGRQGGRQHPGEAIRVVQRRDQTAHVGLDDLSAAAGGGGDPDAEAVRARPGGDGEVNSAVGSRQ